jgi:hypothetical protein
MKNKKKDFIPTINLDTYGPKWMKWWENLQPSWLAQEDGNWSRNTPKDEKWLVLRKGRTAGIYTVIMRLSWWIRPRKRITMLTQSAGRWLMILLG